MRAPIVFAVIALGTFNQAIQCAEASTARNSAGGPTAAHQYSVAHGQGRVNAQKQSSGRPSMQNTASHLGITKSSHAVSGHRAPYSSKAGAAPGQSANDRGRHVANAPSLVGGPAKYDAKKGAVIGGTAMGRKR